MKSIKTLIERAGGLEYLKKDFDFIHITNKPYMDLVVEYVGEGPRGLDMVAVSQCYMQNGNLMRDPEDHFRD